MSAAVIRTVETDKGTFEYDSDMPMGALKGLLGAAQDGNLDGLIGNLAKFVTAWPYKGKPGNVKDWEALRRSEFNAIVLGIMKDLGTLGEA